MKTKLVLWGANAQDERVLIALELLAKDNKVKVMTFPESVATEEFSQKMMQEWRNGTPMEMPEDRTEEIRELAVTEGLLPDELKVERGDLIQRAQTEWHFVVLSSKLNEAYQAELDEIKEKVDKLDSFDKNTWETLKGFWNKVQGQVRDRNLFREHANSLRDNTNALFAQLKELRAKLDEDFQKKSKANVERFSDLLEGVEKKIGEGLSLQPIFDELKDLQRKFREADFTRDHRSKVWQRLDKAFKVVKERRFGAAGDDRSPLERLKRRYDGLLAAIEKMERSIQRDRDDLDFQNRKIANTDGQLEAQIRQAKIKMIEERIRSKEEKLGEMQTTKSELEKRMESQAQKDAKREERQRLEDAKKAAQEKIKAEIKQRAEERVGDEKIEKAADALGTTAKEESETPAAEEEPKKGESMLQAVATTIGESLEDMTDTVKAVAEVVSDKIEDKMEDVKEKMEDVKEKIEDVVEDIKERIMGEDSEEEEEKEEKAEETASPTPEATVEEEAPVAEEPAAKQEDTATAEEEAAPPAPEAPVEEEAPVAEEPAAKQEDTATAEEEAAPPALEATVEEEAPVAEEPAAKQEDTAAAEEETAPPAPEAAVEEEAPATEEEPEAKKEEEE